ncbi:hypothetical protein MM213_09985 [Belliella sp. R4-6]|uniref:DoxX family protein n=1 Tax=Belliella alkalica TaxID=1730871 RepID=A0ABS9VC55_9BACT|nr:hypothetical protein [Belliella alkalica]MCH7413814.1 hypothetical protein [Belliella alkalica]
MNKSNYQLSVAIKTFLGLYILIYCFPFPADNIPYMYVYFSKYVYALKSEFTLFIGRKLLGFGDLVYVSMNGSGDTTVDYLSLVSYSILAILMSIPMLFFLKSKQRTNSFYAIMLIYARYFVGLSLISYGVIKFMNGQFPSPTLMALESTYGDSSPMALAWRFFGYSDLYKAFMGFSELLAGFLLLFRRTAVLGALISIAVCTNIFFVNLSFDVPVKLYSGHLLFFSILISWGSFKSLFSFFLLHKEVSLPKIQYDFSKKWKRGTYLTLKVIFAGLVPLSLITGHVLSQQYRTFLNEWEGVYVVSSMEAEGDFDNQKNYDWEKIIIQGKTIMTLDPEKNKKYYTIENIWNEGEINFIENQTQEDPYQILLSASEDGSYKLKIELDSAKYLVTASRKVKSDYLLINRGFNWINETPYNR